LKGRGLSSADNLPRTNTPRRPITAFQAPSIDRLLLFGDHDSQIVKCPSCSDVSAILFLPASIRILNSTELAAKAFGIQLQYLDVKEPKDVETALQEASKGRAEAILVLVSPVVNFKRIQIVEFAAKNRLLGMYPLSEFVDSGGLVSYASRFVELFRRAATYVDKILKGAKPADLPVEQPTKFEFIINLKAAKQIGLRIPPNVLARADKVIK
jgi:putative tryptophan/tyrosine transport system substrate-binding protein